MTKSTITWPPDANFDARAAGQRQADTPGWLAVSAAVTTGEPKQRGGKRPGAGRPKLSAGGGVAVNVTLRDLDQRADFDALGGSPWLRDVIDRAIRRKR